MNADDRSARVKALREAYLLSGLQQVLEVRKTEPMEKGRFTKMLFEKHGSKIRSLEIRETLQGPYVRIHWREKISPHLRDRLVAIPGTVRRTPNFRVGVNLDGDLVAIARALAEALGAKTTGDVRPTDAARIWAV